MSLRMEPSRINTQMPRRTKVRTATPMASEWDIATGSPPSGLRTPSNKMVPASANSRAPIKVSTVTPTAPTPRVRS